MGAAVGGRILGSSSPLKLVSRVTAGEATLCAAATVVAAAMTGATGRYIMTALLSVAMGWQNAAARRLPSPT